MSGSVPHKLASLERKIAQISRGQRLSHGASIENAAIVVKDDSGSLRTIVGLQGDGTTGVQNVNGPPPPQPSAPIVASVLGGVTVSWDGLFAGGAVIPMDWSRVEVHASLAPVYEPIPETLKTTIETAQGATVVVSCDAPVYVRLLARNLSGAASVASVTIGPFGSAPVVANDIEDGIVTTAKLADDAVTAAKVAVGAIDADALAAAAVTATKLAADAVTSAAVADGAIGSTEISDGAITTPKLIANAVTANEIAANSITAPKLAANSVIAGKINAGAVTAGTIAASAVQAGNLAANSVQAGNVAADGIQAGNIAANAVTARELNALSVTAGKIATNAVTAGTIAAGAVTTNALTVGIAQSIAQKITDAMGDASVWSQPVDTGTWGVVSNVADAAAGGTVIEATNRTSLERITNTPFDPDALYKVTARVRTTVAPTSGTPTVYIGVSGIAADGTTRVNNVGANSISNQHYVAAANLNVPVGTAWTTVTGYIKGTAATGTSTAAPDPKTPGQAQSSVRYLRPLVRLLVGSTAGGTQQVDQVTLETVPTGVVNSVNIANGAVTANSLAADAITGKTITGGTITGSVLQTAASGQRIAIGESNANKVLIYDATGTAVGELSAVGVLLKGSTGALMVMDPNATYPNLRMTNAAGTNQAVLNVVESTPGAANPGLNSGTFTGSGFSDMKWRLFMGTDFGVIERVRDSNTATSIGGRLVLSSTAAQLQYMDTTGAAQTASFVVQAGQTVTQARAWVQPTVGDSNSVMFIQSPPAHTGTFLRCYNADATAYRFSVDLAGNTSVGGALTAGNIRAQRTQVPAPPSGGGTTTATVTFSTPMTATPRVVLTPDTSIDPATITIRCYADNITTSGFTIRCYRSSGSVTNISWIAVSD
ncbi:beta strand repeat-containing protein [Streptomyces sp. NPDC056982]|uniref:beta strand repeat-containing protein n=1 Tax=Streptomyces sp. NPDC056982 TaxID=3345986 RepID=UPI00363793C1